MHIILKLGNVIKMSYFVEDGVVGILQRLINHSLCFKREMLLPIVQRHVFFDVSVVTYQTL